MFTQLFPMLPSIGYAPPKQKLKKIFELHLLLNGWSKFKIISYICSPYYHLPKIVQRILRVGKIVAIAKYRNKNLKYHFTTAKEMCNCPTGHVQ